MNSTTVQVAAVFFYTYPLIDTFISFLNNFQSKSLGFSWDVPIRILKCTYNLYVGTMMQKLRIMRQMCKLIYKSTARNKKGDWVIGFNLFLAHLGDHEKWPLACSDEWTNDNRTPRKWWVTPNAWTHKNNGNFFGTKDLLLD